MSMTNSAAADKAGTAIDPLGSAAVMVAALEKGEVSAEDLLDMHLDRVRTLNGDVNAVVHLHEDQARSEARASDARRAAGVARSPLDGLAITIKDSIATAGLLTTAGTPLLSDHVPQEDAGAIVAWRAAGGIVFGKTNMPPMAGDLQSANPLFGMTRNPWDLSRSPNGSSGGSATALSLGMTPLEIGSDIAGSLRLPAHACGIYAHKPTLDLVSEQGHIPPPPGFVAGTGLATVGPMARSAGDLQLLLDVVAHRDTNAPGWHAKLPPARHKRLGEFRIAIWNADAVLDADAETRAMIEAIAAQLELSGVRVDRAARPFADMNAVVDAYLHLVLPFLAGDLAAAELPGWNAIRAAPKPIARYLNGIHQSRTAGWDAFASAREVQARTRLQWHRFFEDFDAVICPVAPTAPIRHDLSEPKWERQIPMDGEYVAYWDQILWCGALATFAGLPATARPFGIGQEGVPMGFQIIGPFMEDYTPLALAQLLDELFGGFVAPPMALGSTLAV